MDLPLNAGDALDNDPMPQPPEAADLDACCGNGCEPCIFDLHDLAMDQYRQDLRAWQARQAGQGIACKRQA
ncbi:oxidoreductase-like domain-containing protein [Roseateles oligotrophus]|uniref:Oxidoreductase-like domain-containing protein n=1 Tax=Roseateles oligotrophus TaxID=1769250 RepID=A0ABT2YBM3_9BURK|nr:oxidoreductase-like domain-containing protein [Roseateles oligotrophus]MCV2367562.1 oxidoreductase-like domain-containing protein [Roseateles oligotrophus]